MGVARQPRAAVVMANGSKSAAVQLHPELQRTGPERAIWHTTPWLYCWQWPGNQPCGWLLPTMLSMHHVKIYMPLAAKMALLWA